jgi:hypothetical protein
MRLDRRVRVKIEVRRFRSSPSLLLGVGSFLPTCDSPNHVFRSQGMPDKRIMAQDPRKWGVITKSWRSGLCPALDVQYSYAGDAIRPARWKISNRPILLPVHTLVTHLLCRLPKAFTFLDKPPKLKT